MSKKKGINKIIVIIVIVVFLMLLMAGLIVYMVIREKKQYSGYTVVSELTSTQQSCEMLGERALHYSQNGVNATDTEGENLWDVGYKMSNPSYIASEGYGLFYDKGATSVVLVNEEGLVVEYSLSSAIADAGVSDAGVGAFMTQSGNSSSVLFYDKTGRKLDIEVKNVLAEKSGYPISMALSGSGNGLVLSLVYLDKGNMTTRISFLNFDTGKATSDRVVGYYEYDDHLYPQVEYVGSTGVVAFGDDRAVFYSLENASSPLVSNEYVYEGEATSVMAGETMAAVIETSEEGGYVLHVYDSLGLETLNYAFEFEYTEAEISGNHVLIYGGENALITDANHVRFSGVFDGIVSDMAALGDNTFLQYGDFGSRIVKLQ